MAYGDEPFGTTLRIRKTSPALQRQIGQFFIAWSILEGELEAAFPVIFRVDPTLATCLYANLGTRSKIDILASAVDTLWNALGERRVKSVHAILDQVTTLNDRARNTLAHGYHEQWIDRTTGKPMRAVLRYVARKRLTIIVHPGSVKHWRRLTKATLTTAARLRVKIDGLYTQFSKFTEDQLWEATGVDEKAASPIVLRRRSRALPTKAGSKGRRPKPEKPTQPS